MKSVITLFIILISTTTMNAQELPYYEIPKEGKDFTAGTVVSRMVDGLGFRYYWATEGLNEEDLKFKPSDEARSMFDTLDHILVLSIMTLSAVEGTDMDFPEEGALTFAEMRKLTLENFKKTSDILKSADDLSKFVMKIKRRNGKVEEYPFWNQLNGPIADAIWHVGQVVSFRRSAGNPLPKGPSFLTGTVRQ
ncbi:DinB family protein [Tenacibaculum sp. S7007]|uniref:DinB family protein n=1 Tax=Tenacibaculum pelagium TaxID=2759527 RepID=A0A839ANB0_9FLAO|nr:DinB family protein [Tenacibaculum pelagium]MBA6156592.1 DinB family protein [Tenacibaculum pelagium]